MASPHPQGSFYGLVVVRLTDRLMLCKVPGAPTSGFTIPGTAYAELASKCTAPHFRTSAFLNATSDADPTKEIELSYHVLTDDGLGYAVLGDRNIARRQGHALLDAVSEKFRQMFLEHPSTLTPKLVDSFAKPGHELLLQRSGGSTEEDKVKQVRQAVDEVKYLALDNVERAIQRGQRIDDIVQASDDLQFQAQGFQRSSRDLSNQLWWNSMKGKLLLGGVAVFFFLLVLFTFFSGSGDSDKK